MKPVVVVNPPRADADVVAELGELGVATVHEAAGKTGLLGTFLRPAWAGARAAGTALTVLCGPGDNLMVHAAVEQARPGDLLIVTTMSPSSDGFVGELITTSLAAHGARGLVTTTGVRDIAEITAAAFPVWSQFVSAQGTGKAIAGAVNLPVIEFSVDWWTTLHQGESILRKGGPLIAAVYLWPLFAMALGYTLLFFTLWLMRIQTEILGRRARNLMLAEER